jgi:hypothetical protein
MYLYEVGKLYSSRTKWQELAQYNYRGGEHELILFLAHPSSKEVSDLQNGISEFALYVENDLIILLYRFGQSIDWSDAPFSIHLVPPAEKVLPNLIADEARALLHVLLVDASTGIIKAMRIISLSNVFSVALHQAINDQAKKPFNKSEFDRELAGLYNRYSSAALAAKAPIHFVSESWTK